MSFLSGGLNGPTLLKASTIQLTLPNELIFEGSGHQTKASLLDHITPHNNNSSNNNKKIMIIIMIYNIIYIV